MTVNDLIRLTLRMAGVNGVGQTPSAEDANDVFVILNMMLDEWSRKRWLVYHLTDASFIVTGSTAFTIGPGGDIDTVRPDRIESAFARQIIAAAPNQVDYSLEILQSREDYNLIRLKQLKSIPACIFYDSGFPLGSAYVWPVPPAGQWEIHLSLKAPLNEFASLSDTIALPPEYLNAMMWNLGVRVRPAYQLPPDPQIGAQAINALNVIRNANTQIATLRMPYPIGRFGRSRATTAGGLNHFFTLGDCVLG